MNNCDYSGIHVVNLYSMGFICNLVCSAVFMCNQWSSSVLKCIRWVSNVFGGDRWGSSVFSGVIQQLAIPTFDSKVFTRVPHIKHSSYIWIAPATPGTTDIQCTHNYHYVNTMAITLVKSRGFRGCSCVILWDHWHWEGNFWDSKGAFLWAHGGGITPQHFTRIHMKTKGHQWKLKDTNGHNYPTAIREGTHEITETSSPDTRIHIKSSWTQ